MNHEDFEKSGVTGNHSEIIQVILELIAICNAYNGPETNRTALIYLMQCRFDVVWTSSRLFLGEIHLRIRMVHSCDITLAGDYLAEDTRTQKDDWEQVKMECTLTEETGKCRFPLIVAAWILSDLLPHIEDLIEGYNG
ncbi:Hypothetical predicted protein [Octopus vulgaris]|uniref:Uncharacterized protein n=1 Tax=Octopus vulgaris TaxID=6645 RepID=A0AA36AKP0_OCTVU|nr:Hypothetical predicted protein [Octopus vulgaris]